MKRLDIREIEGLVKGLGKIEKEGEREVWGRLETTPGRMAMRLSSRGIEHLTAITGVDTGEEIELVYTFGHEGFTINLVYPVKKQKGAKREKVESIAHVYPVAELYEREIHDLFGTRFEGNPRSNKPIFLDETSPREPHRKKSG